MTHVDETISFITSDDPLGPFRFIVQIAFSSPPWFISRTAWYSENNRALESFDDETPYEPTSVGEALMEEIAAHARQDEETAEVLHRMAEFAHLQRLFRAILDGHIVLTGMDLKDLAELARQTAESVNRAETLSWLVKYIPVQGLEDEALLLSETQPEVADLLIRTLELRKSLELEEQVALAARLETSGCPTPGK